MYYPPKFISLDNFTLISGFREVNYQFKRNSWTIYHCRKYKMPALSYIEMLILDLSIPTDRFMRLIIANESVEASRGHVRRHVARLLHLPGDDL